jgi:hypothetical protein
MSKKTKSNISLEDVRALIMDKLNSTPKASTKLSNAVLPCSSSQINVSGQKKRLRQKANQANQADQSSKVAPLEYLVKWIVDERFSTVQRKHFICEDDDEEIEVGKKYFIKFGQKHLEAYVKFIGNYYMI